MSRRPRASEEVRIRRALLSMAPGGAIKSESPILRHTGQILVPRMGGGPAAAVEPDPCWYFTGSFKSNSPDPGNWAAVSTELLETSSFYISVKLADGPDPGTVWIHLYTQDVDGPYWVEASGPDDDGWYVGFYGQPYGESYADVTTYDIDGPTYGDAYTQTAVRICPGPPPE